MKIIKHLFTLSLIFASIHAIGQEFHWRTADGSVAKNTDNRKTIDDFGGWLLVTSNPDWENQWNSRNIPAFKEAKTVRLGETVTILPFFANPKLDSHSAFHILCDIKLTRPNGTLSIDEKNISCAQSILSVSPQQMFLTRTVIKFVGEEKDPLGIWTVEFTLKDKIRNVSVPLKTSFELIK